MKKRICLIFGVVLISVLAVWAYAHVQHTQDYEVLDVEYAPLLVDMMLYKPEELVEKADAIFEGMVIDVSFIGWEAGGDYYVSTVYTVAVSRTYKGQTTLIEKVAGGWGWEDYKLREQLQAMQDVGAPANYNRIPIWENECKLQLGSTYLFCTQDVEDRTEKLGINGGQFALYLHDEEAPNDYVNVDKVKKHLPYVPHPLLVWGVIGAVTAVAVVFIVRKKRKQTEKMYSSEDAPADS